MILEITYLFKEDKDSEPVTSWFYYHADTDSFASATKKAGAHFKKLCREYGWTRKTTLKSTQLIQKQHEKPRTITIAPPSTPKRKPSGGTRKKSRKA